MEKAYLQYVSGWMFASFGLRPASGAYLAENDDLTPGAHPYAVLSYDYWKRRFGRDPKVVGRTFRMGDEYLPDRRRRRGTVHRHRNRDGDGYLRSPMMMKNHAIVRSDYQWFAPCATEAGRESYRWCGKSCGPTFRAFLEERAKASGAFPTGNGPIILESKAAAGACVRRRSGLQRSTGTALLRSRRPGDAGAADRVRQRGQPDDGPGGGARARDGAASFDRRGAMAPGAIGRWWRAPGWHSWPQASVRCFAWWSAPLIVGMIGTPDNPVRLILPADWRVLGFGVAMASWVTLLFGLAPALRASAVKPASALKGGDPHTRRRLMQR